jgi:hypothetical protein
MRRVSIGRRHLRRALPAIAGAAALVAFAVAPSSAPAAAGNTNPASSALAPLSKKALSKAVGKELRNGGLAPAGSAAAGATRTPRARARAGSGAAGAATATPGGTPAGTPAPGATPSGAGSQTVTSAPAGAKPATGLGAQGTSGPAASSGRAHGKSSSKISTGAIVLAALAALLALASLAWAIARWLAYEPHWIVSIRHAMGEAGFRASATWAEFTDWVRLGR